jgi:hypothetical protein
VCCALSSLWAGLVACAFQVLAERVLSRPPLASPAGVAPLRGDTCLQEEGEEEGEGEGGVRVSPVCKLSFRPAAAVVKVAARAEESIKRAWGLDEDADMLASDFCDPPLCLPELDAARSRAAMEALQVGGDGDALSGPCPKEAFSEFVYCLQQERGRLNKARLVHFDRSWGIDAAGHFGVHMCAQGAVARLLGRGGTSVMRVDVLLERAVEAACRDCETARQQLQPGIETGTVTGIETGTESEMRAARGVRLLQGFVEDLLGRASGAAAVHRTKAAEAG